MLSELRELGVRVEVAGNRLRLTPAKAVPSGLRERIAECKPDLLSLLADEDGRSRAQALARSLERDQGFPPQKAERLARLPVEQMTVDEVTFLANKVSFAWGEPFPSPERWDNGGARGRPTCASGCCWEPRAWRSLDRGDGQPGAWTCVVCHPPALMESGIERREGAGDG